MAVNIERIRRSIEDNEIVKSVIGLPEEKLKSVVNNVFGTANLSCQRCQVLAELKLSNKLMEDNEQTIGVVVDVYFYCLLKSQEATGTELMVEVMRQASWTIWASCIRQADISVCNLYEFGSLILSDHEAFVRIYDQTLNENPDALKFLLNKFPQLLFNCNTDLILEVLSNHLPFETIFQILEEVRDESYRTLLFSVKDRHLCVKLFKRYADELFELLYLQDKQGKTALHVNSELLCTVLADLYKPAYRENFRCLSSIRDATGQTAVEACPSETLCWLIDQFEKNRYIHARRKRVLIAYQTGNRPGSEEEAACVNQALAPHLFQIKICKNFTRREILNECSLFLPDVVFCMGHGRCGSIFDRNDELINFSDFEATWSVADDTNSQAPKVLISECCQIGDPDATPYVVTHDNFLAVMSCVAGQPSERGVFLRKLASRISQSGSNDNLKKLVNLVQSEMEREGHAQTPIILSTLTAEYQLKNNIFSANTENCATKSIGLRQEIEALNRKINSIYKFRQYRPLTRAERQTLKETRSLIADLDDWAENYALAPEDFETGTDYLHHCQIRDQDASRAASSSNTAQSSENLRSNSNEMNKASGNRENATSSVTSDVSSKSSVKYCMNELLTAEDQQGTVVEAPRVSIEFNEAGELGEGSTSKVYRGMMGNLEVACKTPRQCNPESKAKAKAKLFDEGKILSELNHPNIVKFHSFHLIDTNLWLIEEKLGDSLCDTLRKRTIKLDICLKWSIEIAEGMNYLASQNLTHKDLALRNVCISFNDVAKIIDFERVSSNGACGKDSPPAWISAPEVEVIGLKPYSEKSEVWSLGILLSDVIDYLLNNLLAENKIKQTSTLFERLEQIGYNTEQPEKLIEALEKQRSFIAQTHPEEAKATKEIIRRVITPCLQVKPEKRPTFTVVLETLQSINEEYGEMDSGCQEIVAAAPTPDHSVSIQEGNRQQIFSSRTRIHPTLTSSPLPSRSSRSSQSLSSKMSSNSVMTNSTAIETAQPELSQAEGPYWNEFEYPTPPKQIRQLESPPKRLHSSEATTNLNGFEKLLINENRHQERSTEVEPPTRPGNEMIEDTTIDKILEKLANSCRHIAQPRKVCPIEAAYHGAAIIPYESGDRWVQIIRINENHWITASNIGSPGRVQLYDSLNTKIHDNNEVWMLLARLCPPGNDNDDNDLIIEQMDVQRQLGGSDCGLFAMAFAIALCFGQDPVTCCFNQTEMHSHLDKIRQGEITPFPCTDRIPCRNRICEPRKFNRADLLQNQ